MKKLHISIPKDKIEEFCEHWKIAELSFFGSVLRDDFRPDSDVDVLIAFAPDAHWSLFDLVKMQDDLSTILGRTVDLVSKRAVERSHNWIRKQEILESAEVYYAA
jgi:predicted nucleotidyltransferase